MDLSVPRGDSHLRLSDDSQDRRVQTGPVDSEGAGSGSSSLCKPLRLRLAEEGDRAAFEYLLHETSLDALNRCISKIRDQEIAEYLLDGLLLIGDLLSSEAFGGMGSIRERLKALETTTRHDPAAARQLYDRLVESLGQHVFALGRRLHEIESFMERCPFTGSAEILRGFYGQHVRDQAGDVRFMRLEVNRWVRRFVPLQRDLPVDGEGRDFLEARIGAVVDELGLRMREIQESLNAVVFEQLHIFDDSLTRPQFFKRDLANLLDVQRLRRWLGELIVRTRDFDQGRTDARLEEVRTLLRSFEPAQFPALSGLRESDHAMLQQFAQQVLEYPFEGPRRSDDPIQPFLLLLGDVMSCLDQQVGGASAGDTLAF